MSMDILERSQPRSVNVMYTAEAKSVTVIGMENFYVSSIRACYLGIHNREKYDYLVIAFEPETSCYTLGFVGGLLTFFDRFGLC